MEKSYLVLSAVFVGWILTSFACHYCAKQFLKESSASTTGFNYNVIILTGLQLAFCLVLKPISKQNDKEASRIKFVILVAHACATFSTNWSMAVTFAASTFAIKLMEPLTSACFQRLFLGVELSYLQWISIPAVVYGAIVFAEDNKSKHFNISNGTVLAFISNICLSLRNVYMKKNHISCTEFAVDTTQFGLSLLVSTIGVLIIHYLEIVEIAHPRSVYMYGLLICSALFHVIYSYISTVVVLKQFSVVGHSFGNITKRLAVLGLLYMTGTMSASQWNFIGLFICVTGLAVYAFSKAQEINYTLINMNLVKNSNKTKTEICIIPAMFAATVVILLLSSGELLSSSSFADRKVSRKFDMFDTGRPVYNASSDTTNNILFTARRNFSLSKTLNFSIDDFFLEDLVKNPEEANKLSQLLTTRPDVIDEAQRIHMNVFGSLLGKYKYAMLFDYTPSENKGDSAIAVGEIIFLRKLNIEVIFSCPFVCTKQQLDRAENKSKHYTNDELVILFHGGGSVIGWSDADLSHANQIPRFMRFNIIMFPQSILYIEPQSHIDFCKTLYASHSNLTFVWRDKVSFELGKKLFPKVNSLLSPDMAYQIGYVPRFMEPTFDILWIKRTDKESPEYKTPDPPQGFSMHVSDWQSWKTPRGDSPMENIFLMTTNGMMFLQRGRIVVTDRLHGHILSTILGIPHIYIDNKQRKISNYHNTWTTGLENVVMAHSSSDAVGKAGKLLIKLKKQLPKIKGFYT